MARFKRRGFAGLGSAAGGKAVHSIRISVARYASAFRDAQLHAGTDPVKAIADVARAKKALVDAEAGITGAKMARVMVPPEYINDYKQALASVDALNDLRRQAAALVEEMRQTDPEWDNPKYGSAMPDPRPATEPAHWDSTWSEGFMGLSGLSGRGRRRCCRRRR